MSVAYSRSGASISLRTAEKEADMKSTYGVLIFNNGNMDLGLIRALLEADDCKIFLTSLPLEAFHILTKNDIDVILASSDLEGMEGQEFKRLVEKIKPGVSIFMIPDHPANAKAANGSDSEYPVSLEEFIAFIQNHLRAEIKCQGEQARFKDFFFAFTDRLLQIFGVHDNYFFNNNHLVAGYSRKIAEKMGLEETLVDSIHLAALLRDIGKVYIKSTILTGHGHLENDLFNRVKLHPHYTIQLLKDIQFPWSVDVIIRHHHEYYNGNGYPDGLPGRHIPLGSRIIALVDAYVAMTTERPYRKKLTEAAAISEIMQQSGSQFDPEVLEVFLSVLQQKPQLSSRRRILVLDADESESAFIRLNLDTDEFDVLLATVSADALALLDSSAPEIIIADLTTMKNDQFSFYETVRQNTSIPIIVMMTEEESCDQKPEGLVDFIIKPVDIDNLVSRLKISGHNVQKSDTLKPAETELRGVSGLLEDMGVPDIVQILGLGMKTARVTLQRGNDHGELFVKNGEIVFIKQGELRGKEAFFEMIGWNTGEFCILHGQTTDQVNVTVETITLLLESAKHLDDKQYEKSRAAFKKQSSIPPWVSRNTE